MSPLEETFDTLLVEANHKALNRGLLMSCVQASLEMRGTISDASVIDLIATAFERAAADEAAQ